MQEKVTFLVIDSYPEPDREWVEAQGGKSWVVDTAVWFREAYQRNYAARHIRRKYAGRRYVVLACDVDEIPSRTVVQVRPAELTGVLPMHMCDCIRLTCCHMTDILSPLGWRHLPTPLLCNEARPHLAAGGTAAVLPLLSRMFQYLPDAPMRWIMRL
jgi:hypothetical protein